MRMIVLGIWILIIYLTVDALAEQTAKKWKDGLAAWDITEDRIQALRDRAAFLIYTPGSDTGIPVNVLQGLNPPDPSTGLTWDKDAEVLRERIARDERLRRGQRLHASGKDD